MDDRNKRLKVYGSAILFSLIVGFSFLGVKTCVQFATPLETLTYRFNFAFIATIIPMVLGFIKIDIIGKTRKNLVLTAGFYIGFMILQIIGLRFATSIESGIIFAVIPILAKIIAWFFLGEKGNWLQNAFVGVSVTAVIVMFLFSAQDFRGVSIVGLFFLFLSSLSMAISNVFMRYVRNEYTPYAISFAITCGGCIAFNLATLAFGVVDGSLGSYFEPLAHIEFVLAIAFLGIPSTLISSLLMAYVLANIEAVKATIFGNLSTAISIFAGVVVLKEPLYTYNVVCTLLIIIGVIGTTVSGKQKQTDLN